MFFEYANLSYKGYYSVLTNNVHVERAQVRCQYKNEEREEVDISSSVGDVNETEAIYT